MATIKATDLATLLATNIDSTYNVVVFDSSGDTYQVEFESATHQANDNNGCICVKEASLTIPTAEVLTLNTTPVELIPAQGAGTAIEILSAYSSIVYNSVPYATNTTLQIKSPSATAAQYTDAIDVSANTNVLIERQVGVNGYIQIVENEPINVTVATGDPTAGDSDITIYVTYRVITI